MISVYDLSIRFMVQGLQSQKAYIEKAKAHAEAKSLDASALLNARLFPDMFSLTRQVQSVTDLARRGSSRLAGVEPPSVADDETSFEALVERIDSTIAYVQGLDREAIDASETREIVLDMGGTKMEFTGRSYLLGFLLPNFTFHLSTGYNILRHNGVEIGKRDFLTPFVMGQSQSS